MESNTLSKHNNLINRISHSDWQDAIIDVDDNSVDLVVTDPPYGISYRSNNRRVKHKLIENDSNLDWLDDWCKELKRVCKPEAHQYIFCSWHNIDIFKQTISSHLNVKNILIWEKNGGGMGDLFGDYSPQYEMIIFCSNGDKKLNGSRCSNIIKTPKMSADNHPTEKPRNLLRFLIEKSSQKGDLVLDTFAGSFSTARTCMEMGRNFISFEIDEDYVRVANKLVAGVTQSLF